MRRGAFKTDAEALLAIWLLQIRGLAVLTQRAAMPAKCPFTGSILAEAAKAPNAKAGDSATQSALLRPTGLRAGSPGGPALSMTLSPGLAAGAAF